MRDTACPLLKTSHWTFCVRTPSRFILLFCPPHPNPKGARRPSESCRSHPQRPRTERPRRLFRADEAGQDGAGERTRRVLRTRCCLLELSTGSACALARVLVSRGPCANVVAGRTRIIASLETCHRRYSLSYLRRDFSQEEGVEHFADLNHFDTPFRNTRGVNKKRRRGGCWQGEQDNAYGGSCVILLSICCESCCS